MMLFMILYAYLLAERVSARQNVVCSRPVGINTVARSDNYAGILLVIAQRRNATIRGPRHFLRSGPLPSDLK